MMVLSRYKRYKTSYQEYYQEHKEYIQQLQKAWYLNHPQYKRDASRHFREKHKDACNERNRNWRKTYPEKVRAGHLISHQPETFPLESKCEFCGSTRKLEHGHIDYAYPELFLTVCHRCNYWMDKGKVTEK